MKIIVTGSSGFVASHLVRRYRELSHKVVGIDLRFSRQSSDINDAALIKKIFKRERPDIVNHHAAIAEVVKSLRDPLPTFQTNVLGTINLLMAAGEGGTVKKFIFSSTGGAIYGSARLTTSGSTSLTAGGQLKIPVSETAPCNPLSPYGLSKLLAEEAIKFYSRIFGFDYLIFRYPNVYGPGQNSKGEAGVVAIFTEIMRAGRQPTIFGDGTKTRDYVYIEDIVRANVVALRRGKNEILNLGWGRQISDQKVFDEIAKNLNFKLKPIYVPFRKGEVYQIALSAKKAKRVLSWQPKIAFEEGVKKYVDQK